MTSTMWNHFKPQNDKNSKIIAKLAHCAVCEYNQPTSAISSSLHLFIPIPQIKGKGEIEENYGMFEKQLICNLPI